MSRKMVLILILALGLGAVFFIAGNSDAEEPSGTFYQWTTVDGVTAMSGELKGVPAMYRDVAVKRSFAKVANESRETSVTVSAAEYADALERSIERGRKLAERTTTHPSTPGCDGPITIAHERREYKERGNSYNSMFFVTYDACGNEVSVTREQPMPLTGGLNGPNRRR